MIGRIALPKTTSISLNERFSSMRELREKQQEVRLQQSSEVSRQLAEQMETRPAVRAALTPLHLPPPAHPHPHPHQQQQQQQQYQHPRTQNTSALAPAPRVGPGAPPPPQKRLHVKQRLAIQARLGVLRGSGAATRGGALAARLGTARATPGVKRLQSARSPGGPAGGQRTAASARGARGRGRGRGSAQTNSTGRNSTSANNSNKGATAARGRGAVRGAGRGGTAAAAPEKVSREDLDKQLDAYMASTKGHLDAELDAYMKEAKG